MKETYYITTPIYYPSSKLHIGHAYCTVAADSMARYKRLRGYDVRFHTGTDEHGQKIEDAAKKAGKSPIKFVDEIVADILKLWDLMDISYDCYYRTTDKKHIEIVQKIFRKLYEKGDIYKGKYEGLYCTPCETFFTDTQAKDGICPDCGRPVKSVSEEAYFFKLSKYQKQIEQLYEENEKFLYPKTREKEMINNFLKPGLDDLCVSRTSFTWGIPVDFDPQHVVYVWIDALSNYVTALGLYTDDDDDYKKYWPAQVHLVGKEIVRFHAIIWPAILMALGEPLPKQVYGHGWLIIDGGKMSKSKGNVVDPYVLSERYSVDAIRYFLLREAPFGSDINFTNEVLINRINSDLANDLGNLLSRTVGMAVSYFGGTIPETDEATPYDDELIDLINKTVNNTALFMDELRFSDALNEVFTLIRRANKYVDEMAPWEMVKRDEDKGRLSKVLYNLAEILRVAAILISPIMPKTPKHIAKQLNFDEKELIWENTKYGILPKQITVVKDNPIFPRIDIKKELQYLDSLAPAPETKTEEKSQTEITIDDFSKVELKVGTVMECEKVEGSDKLLKSQIKIGDETRQIVSGIAEFYSKEDMIGKQVIVVTNLKPVKIRGVMSYGMVLATSTKDVLSLLTPDKDNMNGCIVK